MELPALSIHRNKIMPSALLVDDPEPDGPMRRQLSINQPQLRILGTAASVAEAVGFLQTVVPDFVYLNWELAGKMRAETLSFLTMRTQVVFVSAYGSHLVHAMPPGTAEEPEWKTGLEAAFPFPAVLQSHGQSQAGEPEMISGTLKAVRRVKDPDFTEIVPLDEILWIEAAQNYSKVYRRGKIADALFHKSMAAWERMLPPTIFRRLSRSVIIRVASIQKLSCSGRDDTSVSFTDSPKQLKLGRAAAFRLKAYFRHGR